MTDREVKGYCPMGCGKTLFLASGGYVTCNWVNCPKPDAAADILLTAETWHIVHLHDGTFDIQHPLRERLNGEQFDCKLHKHLWSLTGPPHQPGRYRAVGHEPPYAWERLADG